MKQKTKKRIITYALIVVWLVGCYFIGRKSHPQVTENTSAEASVAETQTNPETKEYISEEIVETKPEASVTFINMQEVSTDEIPWGFTAGIISLDDGSEAWLLTPETGIQYESTGETTLRCCIHPWMKDLSDGASLQITYNDNSELLAVGQGWTECHIPTNAGLFQINVLSTDNNNGDWVIIQSVAE